MLISLLSKIKVGKVLVYLKKRSSFIAFWYTYALLIKNTRENPLLVYTMGKVGSSSVTHTLASHSEEYSIVQLHWLYKKNLDMDHNFHKALYKKHKHEMPNNRPTILPDYIVRGYFIRNRLSSLTKKEGQLKICTLVRDPVERNISAFFQNLRTFFGYNVEIESQIKNEIQSYMS